MNDLSATPTQKAPAVEDAITAFSGSDRRTAINAGHCVPPPVGCGRELRAKEFQTWDAQTQKEYTISGMCAACQEDFFKESDAGLWDLWDIEGMIEADELLPYSCPVAGTDENQIGETNE